MNRILIVAGENSGEKHGAALVRKFKDLQPSYQFFGIGGEKMAKAGVNILFPIEEMSVMGIFEVLSKLRRITAIFRSIKREIHTQKPDAAVLIDAPDFNLRLARILRKQKVPVLYYISPTVWAWRKGRLKTIKKNVDKMLLIFPFEEKIYKRNEIPASFVGHPLLESVKTSLTKTSFFQKYGLEKHKKLICLLPGSRHNEIDQHLPILMKSLTLIKRKKTWQFILVRAENIDVSTLQCHIPPPLKDTLILDEDRYDAIAYSNLVLAACGTATLEAALLGTPVVTFYRISPLTYLLGKPFVNIKEYSIVNILSGERILPELIQKDFTDENVFLEANKILSSQEIQQHMQEKYSKVKEILSKGNLKASLNAARELEKLILNS